jgi:hypothetical protein
LSQGSKAIGEVLGTDGGLFGVELRMVALTSEQLRPLL